ncbi:hypothetical protein BCIN_12g05640 [Botrytis cinerea B05.10]|uniref:Enoyl reductase (ER) domain-containing protein n=1 Tax=Botryotinia fuckeliana (strain B05.10) TaxID=332648 RepID=A0A384JZJ9_BOTFB|nr:hypothetical protein BCIN_12g05640 [Botrytis cinerea B05.10]ATZ56026.1 hypothetical protein BCIN_12g05640 [Botrytis cinerea B05.10]
MKAVIVETAGKAIVSNIPEPALKPDFVKVKTVAVAINPTDFHHASGVAPDGHILGCDYSGIVEEVGPECKNSDLKKGDRICGPCHGGNTNDKESGTFAEAIFAPDGIFTKIPDSMSFEDAATIGVAILSTGQALYMNLNLPLPTEPSKTPFPILIYGGSTTCGAMAIQFAKLSGLTVITACSPSNFDYVKSLGADAVFDYHSPTCGADIRAYTNSSLHYIYDCICSESTFAICAAAFPEKGSFTGELKLIGVLPVDTFARKNEENVDAKAFLAYTAFGKAFSKFGLDIPFYPEHYEFAVRFWKMSAKLLEEGKIKNQPAIVRPGGLKGVIDGMLEVSEGKVSAGKLVYRIDETPTDEELEKMDNEEGQEIKGPDLYKSQWMK